MRVTVKKTVNQAALNQILNQTKSACQSWAQDVLVYKITPVTPVDTGFLRREADIGVTIEGGDVVVTYYNRAPYADTVESAWGGRFSPRAPGTIAPFARPTLEKAIRETIANPIRRGFTL